MTGTQAHSSGSQFIVSQGEFDEDTDAGAGGGNLTLNVSGGLAVLAATQHLSILKVSSGAKVYVTPVGSPPLVVVSTLTMNGGTIDVTTNDMICKQGNAPNIFQNIQAGFNGGRWNG